ncbi:MAG: ribonuclease Y [Nitrospirae bacterium]|nr:ribonuclease Y [Nitrospirota bacterium]
METIEIIQIVISGIAGIIIGVVIGFVVRNLTMEDKVKGAREQAERIVKDAEREVGNKRKEIEIEAKDKLYQARLEVERETREKQTELINLEKKLSQRENHLEKRGEQLERRENEAHRRERELIVREKSATEKITQYEQALRTAREQLERISGMSAEEAKRHLIQAMEDEAKFEAAKEIKRIEDEAKGTAEKKAREIITLAVQRYANEHVAEVAVSVVNLPNEEMKGRIIGREGRNIRALESATGVDFIVDDTPEAVIISGFDPVRREIARQILEKLIADGRIHPGRIEDLAEKVKRDIEKNMREDAEKVLFELGIHNVHPEIVKLLGRLKYRTSYGQNNLWHAREVAFICGMMAAELGLDVTLCKRASLLHDIGKAVTHEHEGTHTAIGVELAKKYGENPKVINAIASHHGDVEANCVESVLVAAADALSGARPGARRETFEAYIKRLENLEKVASTFKGVEKAYAISAGREIRVIVKHEDISDAEAAQISRDMAKKIHDELTYPGQIKVTVIRESRYVELAK